MSIDVESLREKIASAEGMQSIVETMRTLALVNIRRAEQAVAASSDYLRTVHLGMHVTLRSLGALRRGASRGGSFPTLLVLSSNQGLCGSFNERVTQRAFQVARRLTGARDFSLDRARIVCVGYRGADRLTAMGLRPVRVYDAPGSIEAIGPLVREIYQGIGERMGPEEALIAVYNRPTGGAGIAETERRLLPLDIERWRRLPEGEDPFATIPKLMAKRVGNDRDALPHLIRELLHIDLYRALTLSFAAENAARLASMQGAADNIEERLAELEALYREARQDAVTHELMDILGGMTANEDVRS